MPRLASPFARGAGLLAGFALIAVAALSEPAAAQFAGTGVKANVEIDRRVTGPLRAVGCDIRPSRACAADGRRQPTAPDRNAGRDSGPGAGGGPRPKRR